MTEDIGKVVVCAHCGGTGTCRVNGDASCAVCLRAAGFSSGSVKAVVTCATCGGKGSVWVGPQVVQVSRP